MSITFEMSYEIFHMQNLKTSNLSHGKSLDENYNFFFNHIMEKNV